MSTHPEAPQGCSLQKVQGQGSLQRGWKNGLHSRGAGGPGELNRQVGSSRELGWPK